MKIDQLKYSCKIAKSEKRIMGSEKKKHVDEIFQSKAR